MRAEYLRRHRKKRRHHELAEHATQRHALAEMPGPQPEAILRLEERLEEGQARDVIEMGVRKEKIGVERP